MRFRMPRSRPDADRRQGASAGDRNRRSGRGGGATTRLYVGAGRSAGVRPHDLVGAITGETQLVARDIGAIEIDDRFSLVEVPASAADEAIAAMRGSLIKGKRATVRRERYERKT